VPAAAANRPRRMQQNIAYGTDHDLSFIESRAFITATSRDLGQIATSGGNSLELDTACLLYKLDPGVLRTHRTSSMT